MNKKIVILIHTKNSPFKLNRILENIGTHPELRYLPVIVIDDSPLKIKYCTPSKNKVKCYYINSKIWNDLKDNYILPFLKDDISRKFLDNIILGKSDWNTPNVRNVGFILMRLLTPHATHFLSLDDDIFITPKFTIKNMHLVRLIGIKVAGCPDFGRVSWMQYYLRFINKIYNRDFITTYNPYVDKVVKYLSKNQDSYVIEKYSNLKTPFTSTYKFDHSSKLPVRNEISGGAFISSAANANDMYPSSFNEDFIWSIVTNKGKIRFVDQYVIHKSSPKDILNEELIKMEEYGRIFYKLFELKSGVTKNAIRKLNRYLKIRRFEVEKEIEVANAILEILPPGAIKKQVKKILVYLKKLEKFIKAQDVSIYVNAYKQFALENKLWHDLYKKIETIDSNNQFYMFQKDKIT